MVHWGGWGFAMVPRWYSTGFGGMRRFGTVLAPFLVSAQHVDSGEFPQPGSEPLMTARVLEVARIFLLPFTFRSILLQSWSSLGGGKEEKGLPGFQQLHYSYGAFLYWLWLKNNCHFLCFAGVLEASNWISCPPALLNRNLGLKYCYFCHDWEIRGCWAYFLTKHLIFFVSTSLFHFSYFRPGKNELQISL